LQKLSGSSPAPTRVNRLLGKLNLRDRVQAVVFADETGFAQPHS